MYLDGQQMDRNRERQLKGCSLAIGIGIAISIFVIFLRGCGDTEYKGYSNSENEHTYTSTVEPIIMYSASTILSEYDANEVKADKQFRGKKIQVYGVVRDIKRNVLNNIYVTIQPSLIEDPLYGIHCFFDESDADIVAEIQQGDAIMLEGIGGPRGIFNPTIHHCKMIEQ